MGFRLPISGQEVVTAQAPAVVHPAGRERTRFRKS